jgi:hypothetical protein
MGLKFGLSSDGRKCGMRLFENMRILGSESCNYSEAGDNWREQPLKKFLIKCYRKFLPKFVDTFYLWSKGVNNNEFYRNTQTRFQDPLEVIQSVTHSWS